METEYEEKFAIYVPYLFIFLIPLWEISVIPYFNGNIGLNRK